MSISFKNREWKELLSGGFRSGDDLKKALKLTEQEAEQINKIHELYPVYVNDYYLSLIDPDDPEDPIRKMSVPSGWELSEGGHPDTSGEVSNTILPGMQHKYSETALILSTSQCAMYCRHCFRKRMVGLSDDEIAMHLGEMGDYVKAHPTINNVLISGGDAFLNSNQRIREYLETFIDMEQLELIRFGTRTPVVLPQRITSDPELQDILSEYGNKKQIYVVTQFNHPNEVTEESVEAVKTLMKMGIVVKNQTVLMKGINDEPEMLSELLRNLTACGVVPYYIFQCRPVQGVLNNFQVPLKRGVRIVEEAKKAQNGQGKCVRYAMSHPTGKIEILGEMDDRRMLFQYHQGKNPDHIGKIFLQDVGDDQAWLDSVMV